MAIARVEGDYGNSSVRVTITGVTLTASMNAIILARTPSNRRKYWVATVDTVNNRVSYAFTKYDLDEGGTWGLRVLIQANDGSWVTVTNPETAFEVAWR